MLLTIMGREKTPHEKVFVIESIFSEFVTTLGTYYLKAMFNVLIDKSQLWSKSYKMVKQKLLCLHTTTDISCQIMPQMFHISNQSIPKLCSINTAKLYVIVKGDTYCVIAFSIVVFQTIQYLAVTIPPHQQDNIQKFRYCFQSSITIPF